MFGAFSFTALPRPALSHTEPGLAASTRQTLPTLCASISKTARSVSRGPGATSSRQRRLHTLDVPVATQPAIDANCDSAVSQQDTAVDNSHESKSSATAASTRPAKRTHRKAKEEQQDSPISTDLRCVKAVGPKNEALLLRNGLSSVDRLKEVYKVKHNSNTLALKTFLQVSTVIYAPD